MAKLDTGFKVFMKMRITIGSSERKLFMSHTKTEYRKLKRLYEKSQQASNICQSSADFWFLDTSEGSIPLWISKGIFRIKTSICCKYGNILEKILVYV